MFSEDASDSESADPLSSITHISKSSLSSTGWGLTGHFLFRVSGRLVPVSGEAVIANKQMDN
jgi:hypothetical protein